MQQDKIDAPMTLRFLIKDGDLKEWFVRSVSKGTKLCDFSLAIEKEYGAKPSRIEVIG